MRLSLKVVAFAACLSSSSALAQNLTIYDDAAQNGFSGGYSYGGGTNLANGSPVHGGVMSIAFTGSNFNAVAFGRPAGAISTAQYPILNFWVHGGAAGGQQLRLVLYSDPDGGPVATAELDPYVSGGIVGGQWHQVTVNISAAPFNLAMLGRFDIQSDQAAAQPVLYIDDIVAMSSAPPPAASLMQIEHGVTVQGMVSDRFSWQDSNNQLRVAVLAHNSGQVGPRGAYGGSMREFRYQLPNGVQRIAGLTPYEGAGDAGFGYIVSHTSRAAGCIGDDSPLGGFLPGAGFERVFEGRHHAILRFHQNYPRNCSTVGPVVQRTIPVTIDWMFSTGQDHPVWAVTYNMSGLDANVIYDDSRAPYGELSIDGEGFTDLDGVAWGDRFKFTSQTAPLTMNSAWNWTAANTVPYVKEWLNGPLSGNNTRDATMGIVQTQTNAQQDAGGARDPGVGSDIRPFWGATSAMGNACSKPDQMHSMPCADDWPYQANGNSVGFAFPNGSNNARLTWKTQYGFLGQQTYALNDGTGGSGSGLPRKSYSTWIVLGTHTSSPVESQVTQVETIQSLAVTASVGTVVTSGPAGIADPAQVTYAPAGYNHIYGALALRASGNQLTANLNVENGTLRKPLIIVSNYAGELPIVKINGVALISDAEYFASLRPSASELWITLNRNLAGAANQIEIIGAAGGMPAIPQGVTATAVSTTQIDVSWNAVAGATYQVDRMAPGQGFVQIATPAANSFSDGGRTPGTAYLYRVRATNASGTSDNSTPDLATTVIFTDPALPGVTVKAVHLAELRTAIDAVRTLANVGAGVYTGGGAGTAIQAVHVTQMRSAINAARTPLGLANPAYTDDVLAGVAVKAVHFEELRARVQ